MRELIRRRRVFQEAAEYNARTPEVFQGLGQPQDAERVLNGYATRTARRTGPGAQTELALGSEITFLKLVALGDAESR